jgi:isocitrate lyase
MHTEIRRTSSRTHKRPRACIYDSYVSAIIKQIDDVLGGIGARRMYPLLRTFIEKGIALGHMCVDRVREAKVGMMSVSTLGRTVKKIQQKHAVKGISTTRPGVLVKSEIPLRVGVWE